ncbi:MAG TPA: response regulator [Ignavibacteriaceae bacterium]|nr:response regulator [Ignavibacteriaceae bacterium]
MYDKIKILIADDEGITALDLKLTLQKLGFNNIIIALNGIETLDKYYSQNPDIVLLDIIMDHRLEGIETAKAVKEDNINKPIIFITASTDAATYREAEKINPVAIIIKPFTESELSIAITKALKELINA